ncbi:MAG: META domain-containing protein [Gammaproteobacteria bacterium]|nr:META domain-containing protein [Gammaproteobacteria bacterium]MBU1444467.1 META domain-containing protein [Gammaproteobacteria bacterium]MBU2285381.1 META domain-containing protein [Gammaproteobacteria bacterium]MBU2407290.1 META domain-containing protein [Gammaproteobacteria bacterium]
MRSLITSAALAATLTLTGCGTGIALDEPIEGPMWQLEQLGGVLIEPSNDPRQNAQIRFDSNGRVSGTGGCNLLTGTFERNGSSLKLGQLGATRRACTNPAAEINETQFFAALKETSSYRLQQGASRLALLDSAGRTIATLGRGSP